MHSVGLSCGTSRSNYHKKINVNSPISEVLARSLKKNSCCWVRALQFEVGVTLAFIGEKFALEKELGIGVRLAVCW